MVGNPYLGITSRLPVNLDLSKHFRKAGDDRNSNKNTNSNRRGFTQSSSIISCS